MFESPLFCWIDVDAPQVMSCWGEEEVVVVVTTTVTKVKNNKK